MVGEVQEQQKTINQIEQETNNENLKKIIKEIGEIEKDKTNNVDVAWLLNENFSKIITPEIAKTLLNHISDLYKTDTKLDKYDEYDNTFDIAWIKNKWLIDLINYLLPLSREITNPINNWDEKDDEGSEKYETLKNITPTIRDLKNNLANIQKLTTKIKKDTILISAIKEILNILNNTNQWTKKNLTKINKFIQNNNLADLSTETDSLTKEVTENLNSFNEVLKQYIKQREQQEKIITKNENIKNTWTNFTDIFNQNNVVDALNNLNKLNNDDFNKIKDYIKWCPPEELVKLYDYIQTYEKAKMWNKDKNRFNDIKNILNWKKDEIDQQKTANKIYEQFKENNIVLRRKFNNWNWNIDDNNINQIKNFICDKLQIKSNSNTDNSIKIALEKLNKERKINNENAINNFDIIKAWNINIDDYILQWNDILDKEWKKINAETLFKNIDAKYIKGKLQNNYFAGWELDELINSAKENQWLEQVKNAIKNRAAEKQKAVQAEINKNTPNKSGLYDKHDIMRRIKEGLWNLASKWWWIGSLFQWLADRLWITRDFKGCDNVDQKCINKLQSALSENNKEYPNLDGRDKIRDAIRSWKQNEIQRIQFLIWNDPTWTIDVQDADKLLAYAKAYCTKWTDNAEIPAKILFGDKEFKEEDYEETKYYISKDQSLITWTKDGKTYVWKTNKNAYKDYNNFTWTVTIMENNNGTYIFKQMKYDMNTENNNEDGADIRDNDTQKFKPAAKEQENQQETELNNLQKKVTIYKQAIKQIDNEVKQDNEYKKLEEQAEKLNEAVTQDNKKDYEKLINEYENRCKTKKINPETWQKST